MLVDACAHAHATAHAAHRHKVLHPEVTKGAGLRRLCAALGVGLEQVVAFGDGDNDIEFLQLAGHGLCMKNGRETAKAAANGITSLSNDEDGVAHELRRLLGEGRFG